MKWIDRKIGCEFRGDGFLMFFGNRNGDLESIQMIYPSFEFRFLKQVHGTHCIESQKAELEADAHYTLEKHIALCIRTADCTPILAANSDVALAIHAGWRGVLHKIMPLSLDTALPDSSQKFFLSMGPHIQKDSFQVDPLLGNEFSTQFGDNFVFDKPKHPNKFYVDLKAILQSQLESRPAEVWISDEDTLTSGQYHSHRANPHNKARNISFVARL